MYSTESAISSRLGREYRDPVVHRDGVELPGHCAGRVHRLGDHLADLAQVHMAGHELGEAVGDGDDRLAQILAGDPGGTQQRARPGHVPPVRDGAGA